MSTILATSMIESAKGNVDEYVSAVQSLNGQLQSIMTTLSGDNFVGDAADGYKEFYTSKIVPAIEENLIGGASLTSNIKTILDNIQQQLISTVDPTLGNNNRGAGGAGGAGSVGGAIASGVGAAANALAG